MVRLIPTTSARIISLALCFALIFSSTPLAFTGKTGGSSQNVKRTAGAPSSNLPNLDQARKLKSVPVKKPTPIPSTKCPHWDKVCQRTKENKVGSQSPFSPDGFNRLLARAGHQSWSSMFDFRHADRLSSYLSAPETWLNPAPRAVSDVPMGVNPRAARSFNQPFEAEPGMMFTGPLPGDLAAARLDPRNRMGTPGEDLFSGNFNWSLPLISSPGRAGLDFGLALSYNSLVWTKSGSWITFDPDRGSPSPGFRLGFPVIEPQLYTSQAGGNAYLMIMPSGRHAEFRQVSTSSVYEAADSSYLELTVESATNTMKVRTTDGTQIKFDYHSYSQRFLCSQIKDRNGNYLSATYKDAANPQDFDGLDTVTDTLGRQFFFNYDTNNNLSYIGSPNRTDALVGFGYANLTVYTNFSGLTETVPVNNTQVNVLTLVGFPGGRYYVFGYNSWGQVNIIRHYGDSTQRNYTSYYYPAVSFAPQTDCPRFTQRNDWASDWNSGVQSTYPAFDPNAALGSVTLPDGTIYKEHYFTSGWQKGLSDATEFWSGGVKKKWTATTWTQDNTSVSYPLNPRVTETKIYDDSGNTRRTMVDYTSSSLPSGATCNLSHDVTEYTPTPQPCYAPPAPPTIRTRRIWTGTSSGCPASSTFIKEPSLAAARLFPK